MSTLQHFTDALDTQYDESASKALGKDYWRVIDSFRFYLNDPASLERTMDAHREMELARDAYQQGDEASCRQHALNALQDRA